MMKTLTFLTISSLIMAGLTTGFCIVKQNFAPIQVSVLEPFILEGWTERIKGPATPIDKIEQENKPSDVEKPPARPIRPRPIINKIREIKERKIFRRVLQKVFRFRFRCR